MKGYIKIEAVPEGLACDVHLEDVSYVNRLMLLHSTAVALKLDQDDISLWATGERLGVFAQSTSETILAEKSTCVQVDAAELLKQMREEREDS